MPELDDLEGQISAVEGFLRHEEALLQIDPLDQSALFFADAKRAQLNDLRAQLHREKHARARELLEVRLVGASAKNGSVPLSILARLTGPLNSALASAAHCLATGREPSRSIPQSLINHLDLRLVGIGAGSTRLFISGNTAPDLTGASLLESALIGVFGVLNDDADTFFQAADSIGAKSTRHIASAIGEAANNDLAVEIKWEAPNSTLHSWRSSPTEIKAFRSRIRNLGEPTTSQDTLDGEISKLSDTGSLEVRSHDGARLRVLYSRELFPVVKKYHLGQTVSLNVSKKVFFDRLRRQSVTTYRLADPNVESAT